LAVAVEATHPPERLRPSFPLPSRLRDEKLLDNKEETLREARTAGIVEVPERGLPRDLSGFQAVTHTNAR
jgi:hypothetical protein